MPSNQPFHLAPHNLLTRPISLSLESIFEMYEDMAKMGNLPRPKVGAARPMV